MAKRNILIVMLTVFIVLAMITSTEAATKVKFDKKKLAAIELIDAKPKLEPLVLNKVSPEEITILGPAEATQAQMLRYLLKRNPKPLLNCTPKQIIQIYYEEADREGIRPDVALCQAFKETGFFGYGGDVSPSQNNYCGLGATGNKVPGHTFESPQVGARAHIQHLLAYTSPRPPKLAIVDPRYDHLKNNRPEVFGKTKYWVNLNGIWAVPGKTYGQDIIKYWQQAQMPDGSAESLAAANRNLKLNAPTADMFVYRGLVYFARGEAGSDNDYYNAIDDFESAVLLKPDSADALYNLAVTYETLGKSKDAIETYDKLLAIDDQFTQAFYNRGHLKLLNGDYENAIADFRSVLELEAVTADAHNEIAIAHFKQNMYQEAYADIQKAHEVNSTNKVVLANKKAIESCIKTKK